MEPQVFDMLVGPLEALVELPVRRKMGLRVGIQAAIKTRYPSMLVPKYLVSEDPHASKRGDG